MNIDECSTCIKRKTKYCPNSRECLNTDDKPYYQNRIMLLEENEEFKTQQKKFIQYLEDKVNFAKINMQGYTLNIYEEILSKYKEIIGNLGE